jgi:hypothetical protein
MPSFDLSTILGASAVVLAIATQLFPNQQWLAMIFAGVSAVVMKETPKTPEPLVPTKTS